MLFLHTLQTFYKQNVWKPYENNSPSSIDWKELAVSCQFITKVNIYLYFWKQNQDSLQRIEGKVVPVWEMKFRPKKMRYVSSQQASNSDIHLSLTKAGSKSIQILTSSQSLLNRIFITYFCNFLCTFCAL